MKDTCINTLRKELEERKEYLNGETIETIYFGGGTPSLLAPADFQIIFDTIFRFYNSDSIEEITLEANPDDLNREYLAALAKLPFNRLSIGTQTFNDDMLKLLNRRHNAAQAVNAVKDARAVGFNNISIDLIYGLPGQSQENLEKDIQQAICLETEHISAYYLTYEQDTVLYSLLRKQVIEEIEEEAGISFFKTLIHKLTFAGYEHYEISNFCKPGMYSRHNSGYWNETAYLGCGPSAHSCNGISREWNISSLPQYIKGMESGTRRYEEEILDTKTRYNDFIITSLRTREGVSLTKLEKKYGDRYMADCLGFAKKHIINNELEIVDNYLRLTSAGIFISDGIMSNLLRLEE